MFKNVAGQKLTVYAFDSTTNLPKTGDAANLTAYRDLDDGGVTVLTDTSATEKDATNAKGFYIFDLTQAETNGDKILFTCKSSTADIVVLAMPAVVYTLPATGILAPTTAGRTLDVTATGAAGIDWGNVENPTTALNLSGTNIDVDQIVASVSGAVGSVAAGGITEASFATTAGSFAPLGIVDQGTMQAGSTGTTAVLRAGLSLVSDIPNGSAVRIVGGTGEGQIRTIDDFDGASDTATVSPAWTTTPDNTSEYQVVAVPPASTNLIGAFADQVWEETLADHEGTVGSTAAALATAGGSGASAADIADAVLDEALSGHTTAGSLGKAIGDTLADTNELQTDWANGGRLDLIIDATATTAELAKVPKSDSNVTWNATAAAQIQSEANDALVANHLDHLYATSASVNDAGASTTAFNTTLTDADNFWDDAQLTFTSGALTGQSRLIVAYANANGGITFDEPLTSAPANGVTFVIKAVHAHSKSQITSDVWNNGTRTLTDKTGFSLSGTQTFNNTGTWTGNIVGTVSTVTTVTTVTTLTNKTGFSLAATGLDLVVPADPSAIPVLGTASVVSLIGWFGAWSLNEVNSDANSVNLRNSADNADLAAHVVSDDGTTFSSSEPS